MSAAKATTVTNGAPNETPLISSFKAARRASTPIVAIETPDPAATVISIRKILPDKTPVLSWDCATGLRGLNEQGKAAFAKLGADSAMTVNGVEALLALSSDTLPENTVVFLHNAHRQINETPFLQALWNLRDTFAAEKRSVVLLGPIFQLPAELSGDVITLVEPLPTRAELSAVIDQQHKNGGLPLPDDDVRAAALDALVGLPTFTSQQVMAMSLEKKGVSIPKLWERKIKAIENTEGLQVWTAKPGDTTIDELKGLDNVVAFMQKLIAAEAFGTIVFIDEGDKAFAGGMSDHTGDSGVSKDQVGVLLSYIENTRSLGVLLAGVAGSGKTQLAKAVGAASGKPVIMFDLGALKGGVVGESERKIRAALRVVTATAEGRVLFIMTANKTTIFTPELNRRFPDQFFFDVLSDDGRAACWPVYAGKNNLTKSQTEIPAGFDKGWTGAEIQRACERAALFGESVVEAARYIIPQSVSARTAIADLRRNAAGRFLSASHAGFYEIPTEYDVDAKSDKAGQRQIEVV